MPETALNILAELNRRGKIDTVGNSRVIDPLKSHIVERFEQKIAENLKEILDYSFSVNGNPHFLEETNFYEGAVSCIIRDEELRAWALEKGKGDYTPPMHYMFALAVYAKGLAKQNGLLSQRGLFVQRRIT